MDDPDYITVEDAREIVQAHGGAFSLRSTPVEAEFTLLSGMRALNAIRKSVSYDLRLLLQPFAVFQGHLFRDVDALDPERAEVLRLFFGMKKDVRTRMNELMKRIDTADIGTQLTQEDLDEMKGKLIGVEFFLFTLQTKFERVLYRGSIAGSAPPGRRLKDMQTMVRFTREACSEIFDGTERLLED